MNTDRIDQLLNGYFDEALDAEEKCELEQWLLAWPQARQRFWDRSRLHANLRQIGQESWGQQLASRQGTGAVREIAVQEISVAALCPSEMGVEPERTTSLISMSGVWQFPALRRCVYSLGLLCVGSVIVFLGWRTIQTLGMRRGSSVEWLSRVSPDIDSGSRAIESRGEANQSSGSLGQSGVVQSDIGGWQEESVSDDFGQERWVGVLRKAIDVRWSSGMSQPPHAGEPLGARVLEFDQGLVEIQTSRGALLVLEGPARLELVSAMEVRCESGRLRVDVPPPAVGFQVHTPLVNVIDRGTSFAMNVRGEEVAEVHVIKGQVDLATSESPSELHSLRAGQSVSVDEPGRVRHIARPEIAMFPSAASAAARTRQVSARSLIAWERQAMGLKRDRDCLVYYDFQKVVEDDTLLRNGVSDASSPSDGTIIGCNWTEGRWPGKQALDFKNVSDRVRFEVPGKHSQLTLVASVRLDALDHAFNALLMSGDAVVGELQWQISLNATESLGRMRVGRRPRPGWGYVEDYRSEPMLRREQFGTWLHLAVVWDAREGQYRQYLDGRRISEGSVMKHEDPQTAYLHTGQLELGNWTPKVGQPREPIRNFSGLIDEFAMFSRALSDQEILELYQLRWSPSNSLN